jgi:hypothetical protein
MPKRKPQMNRQHRLLLHTLICPISENSFPCYTNTHWILVNTRADFQKSKSTRLMCYWRSVVPYSSGNRTVIIREREKTAIVSSQPRHCSTTDFSAGERTFCPVSFLPHSQPSPRRPSFHEHKPLQSAQKRSRVYALAR